MRRDSLRRDLEQARRLNRAYLAHAVLARYHRRAPAAELPQRAGDHVEIGPVRNADELPLGAGGVRQRSEEVEDRADCELLSHGHDVLGRAMVSRREHEAEADVLYALGDRGRLE